MTEPRDIALKQDDPRRAVYHVHFPDSAAVERLETHDRRVNCAGGACRVVLWEDIDDARAVLEAMGARVVRVR